MKIYRAPRFSSLSIALLAAIVAVIIGLTGCASLNVKEPLGTEHLQEEAKNPGVSIVLLHFKTQQRHPNPTDFSEAVHHTDLKWIFAVANDATGWCFRPLDYFAIDEAQVFPTRDDSMEKDEFNVESGWVTFLAPPGMTYIAVTSRATEMGRGGLDLVATPFPDRILVGHQQGREKDTGPEFVTIDFIDTPRLAVQVPKSSSLIYAGTIVRSINCAEGEGPSATCPYELTVIDESEIAKKFVTRYRKSLTVAPMLTQLLTIPQSRTIEIRGDSTSSTLPH